MTILKRLNNALPATYDGVNPEAGDPFVAAESAVRAMLGNDTFHYSVLQRATGDLMVRDLILLQNQRNLLNHVNTNSPAKVLVPSLVVPANGQVLVAQFETFGSVAVAHSRLEVGRLYTDIDPEDAALYEMRLLTSTNVVLFSNTHASAVPWIPIAENLQQVSETDVFKVIVVNATASPVTMSGSLVLVNPQV